MSIETFKFIAEMRSEIKENREQVENLKVVVQQLAKSLQSNEEILKNEDLYNAANKRLRQKDFNTALALFQLFETKGYYCAEEIKVAPKIAKCKEMINHDGST